MYCLYNNMSSIPHVYMFFFNVIHILICFFVVFLCRFVFYMENNILKYVLVLLAVIMVGCKTQLQTVVANHDSIRVEYKLDSVFVYEHDSIYVDRYRSNDTVYLTTEKWLTRWKDKIVLKHDSIVLRDSIPYEVQTVKEVHKRNGYDIFVSWGFWILIVLLLVRIAWWAFKTFYLHKS